MRYHNKATSLTIAISPIAIDVMLLPFRGLSVFLSVKFVHCAQTAEDIDTISFAYDSPIYLPDRVKNLDYIDQHLLPQILPPND